MATVALSVASAVLAGAAAYALRRAWRTGGNQASQRLWTLAGWAAVIGCGVASSAAFQFERGVVIALMLCGVAGLAFVVANAKWRSARPPRDDIALTPSLRGARLWRGGFRFLLAGPISGAAAIGLALAFTLKAPLGEVDKLIFGGSLVPLLWGAGMAWTLADDRILRAAAALLAAGAAGFAISVI